MNNAINTLLVVVVYVAAAVLLPVALLYRAGVWSVGQFCEVWYL